VSLGELSQIVRLAVDVPYQTKKGEWSGLSRARQGQPRRGPALTELVVVDRLAGSLDLGLGGAVEDDAIEVRILLIPDSSACARNHRAFVHVWVNAPAAGGRHPPQS
jgi:hypothetical protein